MNYKEMETNLIQQEMNNLSARQHFLLRAISRGEIKETDKNENDMSYSDELELIDTYKREGTSELLSRMYSTIQAKVQETRTKITSDGDFKRAVAVIIIDILKPIMEDDEVKGVARQMYKIMRA